MRNTRTIHVVVASPSDVEAERRALQEVISAAGRLTRDSDLNLELRGWEEAPPGLGVQDRIEDTLRIDQCDVLIGVFWKRFGDLDANGQTPTQREIEAALARRTAGGANPEVMVYFCAMPYSPASVEEARQRASVLEFKKDLQNRNVLTADYQDPGDFKFNVLVHLMDLIWRLTPSPALDTQAPTEIVTCVPTLFRSLGWTELVEDLKLEVAADGNEGEQLIISLFANTYITSRITTGDLTEILLTTRDGDPELSRGRWIRPNGIQFDPISLRAGEQQHLLISGIRLDAHDLNGTSAIVEVIIAHADKGVKERLFKLVKHSVTVAHVQDSMTFEVRRLDHRIDGFYALTVHARERFSKALKTREEERSTHGTVLSVWLGHAEGVDEMFVTARDIPSGDGAESNAPARALAIAVNRSGRPIGPAAPAASPVWPGNIAMIAASDMRTAAWEIIAPMPSGPGEVVFGVLLKCQVPPGGFGLYVGVNVAPFYSTAAAHLPSSTLPVPRFALAPVSNPLIWIG